ncbi:hypothetical protein ACFL1X_04425 [Candidatus Hydrogenedentota bacterium]
MRTPMRAMIWELWRLTRWDIVLRIAAVCFLVGVIVLISATRDWGSPEMKALGEMTVHALTVFLVAMASLLPSSFVSSLENPHGQGYPMPLAFTRPISTRMLTFVPLAYFALASAVICMGCAFFIRILCSMSLPWMQIAVTMAVVTTVFNIVHWSVQGTTARTLCIVVLLSVFGVVMFPWLVSKISLRDPLNGELLLPPVFSFLSKLKLIGIESFQKTGSPTVEWQYYAVLIGCFGAMCSAAPALVGLKRHGQSLELKSVGKFFKEITRIFPKRRRPFSSPDKAQLWFEIRRGGTAVLITNACVLFTLFIATFAWDIFADFSQEVATLPWCIYMCAFPAVVIFHGTHKMAGLESREGVLRLSPFDGTRPMSNGTLIFIKFKALVACTIIGMTTVAFAAIVWTVIWGDFGAYVRVCEGVWTLARQVPLVWWPYIVLAAIVVYWTISGIFLSASFGFVLHPVAVGAAFVAPLVYLFLGIWGTKQGWFPPEFWAAHAWGFSGAVICAALWVLRSALNKGCLTGRVFAVAVCVLAYIAAGAVAIYDRLGEAFREEVPLCVIVVCAALLIVPLSLLGAAPLALGKLRHK